MLWGRGRKCKALAQRFVAAINARDLDTLGGLVTDEFTFIDSWRQGIVGRGSMLVGLQRIFADDPGFRLDVESMSFSEPFVLLRGWVESARPEIGRVRATWRARCDDGVIGEWQAWTEQRVPGLTGTYSPDAARDMSDRAAANPGAP